MMFGRYRLGRIQGNGKCECVDFRAMFAEAQPFRSQIKVKISGSGTGADRPSIQPAAVCRTEVAQDDAAIGQHIQFHMFPRNARCVENEIATRGPAKTVHADIELMMR